MAITQPKFNVDFKEEAVLAIAQQERGHVIVVLDDDTDNAPDKVTYKTLSDVPKDKLTTANYQLLQLIFAGYPTKVTVILDEETVSDVTAKLDYYDNYTLICPNANATNVTALQSYIGTIRGKNNYSRIIVANATSPDKSYIINFCTPSEDDKITVKISGEEVELTPAEYTCRIAGALCGLAISRSLTYYELAEIVDAPLYADADVPAGAGKLIILHQDGSFKFGRAVNSLVTLSDGVTEAFQKIRLVETMDTIANDIVYTFRTGYVGKYTNNYTNKQRFVLAINSYLSGLADDGRLESENTNEVEISYEKNKAYLKAKGVDVDNMTVLQILKANTGSKVLLDGVCSPTDAMEDLDLGMYLFQELQVAE